MSENLAVAKTIEECGTSELAREMGLPISTVHTWKRFNDIPGRGTVREAKIAAFNAAVKKVRRRLSKSRAAA